MSRDDDDSFEWSTPKPVNPIGQFIQGGKLTEKGLDIVHFFSMLELIPDDGCLLDWSVVYAAFQTWKHSYFTNYAGFSLDLLNQDDDFQNAIAVKHGLMTWDVFHLDDADRARLRESHFSYESGVRARLRDRIGVEAFNPDEDEANAKVKYLVERLLPLHGVHMFVSLPETLKSWTAFAIAIAVSKGRPALGRFPTQRGRTVVFDWEVGSTEIKRRFRILDADGAILFKCFPTFKLSDEQFWIELEKLRPDFVTIDSLSAGSGNEYSELDSRFSEPLSRAARFAETHRCTFLFIHHSPKAATVGDVESLFRGTGAIRSKVDSAFYFRRLPTGTKGEARAEVTSVKSRKGVNTDRFAVQISDDRGVELFDMEKDADKPATPPTNEERAWSIIAAEPGCSGNRVSEELELRRETVSAILDVLEQAGRVRREGKGRTTGYFVIESLPDSLPRIVPGSESDTNREVVAGNAPVIAVAPGEMRNH